MNITICENLKKLRREKGNTQQELADHLGMSVQSVSKWECGGGYPDITLIPAIALYYNVSADKLLGMDEKVIEAKIKEYETKAIGLLKIRQEISIGNIVEIYQSTTTGTFEEINEKQLKNINNYLKTG